MRSIMKEYRVIFTNKKLDIIKDKILNNLKLLEFDIEESSNFIRISNFKNNIIGYIISDQYNGLNEIKGHIVFDHNQSNNSTVDYPINAPIENININLLISDIDLLSSDEGKMISINGDYKTNNIFYHNKKY